MVTPTKETHNKIVQRLSSFVPKFQDIFDEEGFYIFFAVLTIGAIAVAVIAMRFTKVKDAGHTD